MRGLRQSFADIAVARCQLLVRLSVVFGIALLAYSVSPARADDLPPTPPQGWWWYYGQTPAQVNALLTANKARLLTLQVEQASAAVHRDDGGKQRRLRERLVVVLRPDGGRY